MTRVRSAAILLVLCALLPTGCASQKPVLYPNSKLQSVSDGGQTDVAACMELADNTDLEKSQAAAAARNVGGGAVVGGAAGAVGGAIGGAAGRGAGIGAATGAVFGLFRWMFSAREPDPLYVNYVNICLAERGYRVVGWK